MKNQALNPIGGYIITTQEETQLLDTNKYGTSYGSKYKEVVNLSIKNIGDTDIIFRMNKGEKITLKPNDSFISGEYKAYSLIIYNNNANLRWSAFIYEPYIIKEGDS